MYSREGASGLALLAFFLVVASPAGAQPTITYAFTAEIDTVVDGTASQLWANTFSAGQTISGSVRFDATLTDQDPSTTAGSYESPPPSAPNGVTMHIGGVTLAPDSTQTFSISVLDMNSGIDWFQVSHAGDWTSEIPGGAIIAFQLNNGSAAALASDALPTELDLAEFGQTIVTLDGALQGGECVGLGAPCVIGATVTSIQRVPEIPAAGLGPVIAGAVILLLLAASVLANRRIERPS